MIKKFDLYRLEIKIGTLTATNRDMRIAGTIDYTFDYASEAPQHMHLANAIKHSIKTFNYLEAGDQENYERMCAEEELKYMDLVNSTAWHLVDSEGASLKIICPIFLDNNEVIWQKD